MSEKTTDKTADELTPALRTALVELGAIIPTTSEEVELAEANFTDGTTAEEEAAAFQQLQRELNGDAPSHSFMKLNVSFPARKDGTLSVAARNGEEIDVETRARIERSVDRVIGT